MQQHPSQPSLSSSDDHQKGPTAGITEAPEKEDVPLRSSSDKPRDPENPEEAQWGIGCRSPSRLLLGLILRIVFACGHHLYYRYLNGTLVHSASQQRWAIQVGTGLAFLTKTALGATITIAFAQQLWSDLRRQPMSVEALDCLFSITSDPRSFLNLEVLLGAKVLVLLALISWFLPLIATITPATLSVETLDVTTNSTEPVPSADFSTDFGMTYEGAASYGPPDPALARILMATAASVTDLPVEAPFPDSSYIREFHGPSLKCDAIGGRNDSSQYYDIWDTIMSTRIGRSPIYIGYAQSNLSNVILLNAGGNEYQNFSCQLWNNSFVVHYEFSESLQTTTILEQRLLAPANWSINAGALVGGISYQAYSATLFNLLSGTIQQGSIGNIYMSAIPSDDTLQFDDSTAHRGGGSPGVLMTALAACPEINDGPWYASVRGDSLPSWMCRNGSLGLAVEDLARNFTLSLSTMPQFWPDTSASAQVTSTSPKNFFTYNPENLLISYLLAIVATMLILLLAARAYHLNGVSPKTSFSTIMLTTRNTDLDVFSEGQCLGKTTTKEDRKAQKLQFGILNDREEDLPGGVAHAAFGFSGTVRQLKKGERCM